MAQNVWPIDWPESVDLNSYTPAQIEVASELAINTLRSLTLNRVGQVTVRARPSIDGGFSTYNVYSWHHDNFFPSADLLRQSMNFMHPFHENTIRLVTPVAEIIAVRNGGITYPPDSYEVIDGGYLKLNSEIVSIRDVEVEYIVGYPVSAAGRHAAGILAAEYLKAMTNKKCALPRGVTEISRQGVTFTIEAGLFPNGQTDITEVDLYVHQWNPYALKTKPAVYSPDLNKRRGAGGRW